MRVQMKLWQLQDRWFCNRRRRCVDAMVPPGQCFEWARPSLGQISHRWPVHNNGLKKPSVQILIHPNCVVSSETLFMHMVLDILMSFQTGSNRLLIFHHERSFWQLPRKGIRNLGTGSNYCFVVWSLVLVKPTWRVLPGTEKKQHKHTESCRELEPQVVPCRTYFSPERRTKGCFHNMSTAVHKQIRIFSHAPNVARNTQLQCELQQAQKKRVQNILTIAFEALVNKSVQQRPAVVTERRTSIGVNFELVMVGRLKKKQIRLNLSSSREIQRTKRRPNTDRTWATACIRSRFQIWQQCRLGHETMSENNQNRHELTCSEEGFSQRILSFFLVCARILNEDFVVFILMVPPQQATNHSLPCVLVRWEGHLELDDLRQFQLDSVGGFHKWIFTEKEHWEVFTRVTHHPNKCTDTMQQSLQNCAPCPRSWLHFVPQVLLSGPNRQASEQECTQILGNVVVTLLSGVTHRWKG